MVKEWFIMDKKSIELKDVYHSYKTVKSKTGESKTFENKIAENKTTENKKDENKTIEGIKENSLK